MSNRRGSQSGRERRRSCRRSRRWSRRATSSRRRKRDTRTAPGASSSWATRRSRRRRPARRWSKPNSSWRRRVRSSCGRWGVHEREMAMRRWIMAAIGIVLVAAVVWFVRRPRAAAPGAAQQQQQQRPIPVVTGTVQQRDVPIYLDGLGTVIATKTVTVRPQVDGRLDAVLYREGQVVRRGQVLAQIDPRPFQVQLKQAEGALARDAAQLKTARITLER